MKADRLLEIRGLSEMGLEGSIAGEELKEAVEEIDLLRAALEEAGDFIHSQAVRSDTLSESKHPVINNALNKVRAALDG